MSRTLATALSAWAALGLAFFAPPLLAQDPAPTPTAPASEAEAEVVSLPVLEAELRPLTKDQVQAELDDWLGLLQAKCAQVSDVEIRAMALDGRSVNSCRGTAMFSCNVSALHSAPL